MNRMFASVVALCMLSDPANARTAHRSADRTAIATLLANYTAAVSRKDQALFETLLLSTDIPFAYVPAVPTGSGSSWRDYDGFRRAVFAGASFTQSFENVNIRLHGALADVDLVYVNRDRQGAHPGWKTMQLIKIDGRWKIASEFFTDLPSRTR